LLDDELAVWASECLFALASPFGLAFDAAAAVDTGEEGAVAALDLGGLLGFDFGHETSKVLAVLDDGGEGADLEELIPETTVFAFSDEAMAPCVALDVLGLVIWVRLVE